MSGSKKVFTTLGSSNHVPEEREAFDYYATDPRAVEMLLELEQFSPVIWEPACGEGHISKVLQAHSYEVISTDLIYRGFGDPEPLTASKPAPEKPKSEFAKGPVVDGVQVYEALAAEIDRGTGFVHGKLRVQDFYEEKHPTIQQLADFLSVDRSAMSNELSKMREEGLLEFHKNEFTLLL